MRFEAGLVRTQMGRAPLVCSNQLHTQFHPVLMLVVVVLDAGGVGGSESRVRRKSDIIKHISAYFSTLNLMQFILKLLCLCTTLNLQCNIHVHAKIIDFGESGCM